MTEEYKKGFEDLKWKKLYYIEDVRVRVPKQLPSVIPAHVRKLLGKDIPKACMPEELIALLWARDSPYKHSIIPEGR
jgi:serine/threonine protein phosphatase PrpC